MVVQILKEPSRGETAGFLHTSALRHYDRRMPPKFVILLVCIPENLVYLAITRYPTQMPAQCQPRDHDV
jgi:hypothetical protein